MVMKLKHFIPSLLLLINAGCASKPPVYYGPDAITCVHKHDDNIVVQYRKENFRQFVMNDIIMFQIIDIEGNEVFWNIYEIENYECTQ